MTLALQGFDIHWHDGLFVLQHHLQGLQRSMNARDAGNRSLAMRHPWGILEMAHQEDALSEGMISFRKLKAIMPSGQFVDVPYSADLEPLRVSDAIKTAPSGVRVMLAVPNWTPTGANMADENSVDGAGRWKVDSIEARDENDGSDPEQILVRRLNARLVLENNVPAGMEVLPLVRVNSNRQNDNFSISLDASYAPPSIRCEASTSLMSLGGELAARLSMAREEHLAFLSRGGYEVDRLAGQQVEWMLRLQAISSSLPRLSDSVWLAGASPYDLYHELRQLLGQLVRSHSLPAIKKEVLMEYLIKEIDCLEPLENVYKTYVNSLLEISKMKYFNATSISFREKFILLIKLVEKKDILLFCKNEFFVIEIELVEDVLGRKLKAEDYD